jgi:hemolysin III
MSDGETRALPRYTRGERTADAVVHALGVPAALIACAVLAMSAERPIEARHAVPLIIYAAGLIGMLGCSALYNLTPEGPRKALFRRFDHAAIFVMIAGTYTSVLAFALDGVAARALLASVWLGAAAGIVLKLLAPDRFERASIGAYLVLGWAGLAALGPLHDALPAADMALILVGGLLYSIGVAVHLAIRMPYHNAIWHSLVLAAAGCHYAVVLRLAAG